MIKIQEMYKVCEGLESCDRKAAIKKLMTKGFNESAAIKFYNIWRRHYLESSSEEDISLNVRENCDDKSRKSKNK